MNELTPAEKQQRLNQSVDLIANFFERETGEYLKKYILGTTNVKKYARKVPSYIVYINNILSLAFIFAYGSLRCDINTDEPISKNASTQSSERIINSLQKAYTEYPVTTELIQFVLTDIQFELLQGDNSKLYDVFRRMSSFKDKHFNLNKYFKLIAEWRVSPARFNADSGELAYMLVDLLKNMEFLRSYSLEKDEEGNFFFASKDAFEQPEFRKVPASYLLYYNQDEYIDFFTLFGIAKSISDEHERLELKYICEKNSQTFSIIVTDDEKCTGDNVLRGFPKEVYENISFSQWNSESEDSSKKNAPIDQVHTINYKYIKNLALAISDSLDMDSKQTLLKTFGKYSSDIFGQDVNLSNVSQKKLNWDSIIVMLLIEYGPTSVLEALFYKHKQAFIKIDRNLCKRIDNAIMPFGGRDENELMQEADKIKQQKLIFGEASAFGKIPDENNQRLLARAMAMLIISSLSAVHEEETVEKSICAGNIYDNMTLLEKMKTTMTPEQRCKYVCIILSETFRHIICFYKGLIAYGEKKSGFDVKSSHTCLSETDIAKDQKALHESFLLAAKQEADALKGYNASNFEDMIALMHRFIELCEMCGSGSGSVEPWRRALYSAIGKYELLNAAEFKKYVLGYAESLKHLDESNINEWISFAFHILEYLRNGTFELSGDNPSRAIYPYTATCNSDNENYDGYKTLTFSLNFDFDGDAIPETKEIKVLSEFSYDLSNVFYCLPNVLRTSNSWWIDPVLINFKDFNDIFVD